MTHFTVFHYTGNEGWRGEGTLQREWPGPGYVPVAQLAAQNLDDVFEKTNHIHSDWRENEGLTWVARGPQRSTSVGDVIVDDKGYAYGVASMGFTPLGRVDTRIDARIDIARTKFRNEEIGSLEAFSYITGLQDFRIALDALGVPA